MYFPKPPETVVNYYGMGKNYPPCNTTIEWDTVQNAYKITDYGSENFKLHNKKTGTFYCLFIKFCYQKTPFLIM